MLFLVAQHSSEFPRRSGSQKHFQQEHQALMSPPLLRRSAVPLGCGRAPALGAAPAENSPGGLGLVQLSRAHLGPLYAREAQCLLSLQPIETAKGPGDVFIEYLKPRLSHCSGEPFTTSQPRDWCKLQSGIRRGCAMAHTMGLWNEERDLQKTWRRGDWRQRMKKQGQEKA